MNSLRKHLASRGITKLTPNPRKRLGLLLKRDGVKVTRELKRCRDLPRRVWTPEGAQELVEALTPLLATPQGSMELLEIQALALDELHSFGGLFGPIVVGGGKTLISFLAPTVAEAKRPLLLIPASLRNKTKREFKKLREHWWVDSGEIKIMNYEILSREHGEEELQEYNPDLIIADECHRLKNMSAACTSRVGRWMEANPDTLFVAMSGTITTRSLKDYAHILEWCLPRHCPLPTRWGVLIEWCQAVDEKIHTRLAPGGIELLYDETERKMAFNDELAAARSAVRRRVTETPGVVATSDVELGCSLRIDAVSPKYPKAIDQMFADMHATWETPHGQPISDPMMMWRKAQELALGFVYRWDPEAPPEWMAARKLWYQCCRHIIKHNPHGLDSELPVSKAVAAGWYDGKLLYKEGFPISDMPVEEVYAAWKMIRPTFKINRVPVWYDDTAINYAVSWMKKKPGICWVAHRAFGERLAKISKAPYFVAKGKRWRGKTHVEDWDPKDGSIICSIGSNKDGRNLQHSWHRSLVMSPPANGKDWEQMLGRTHRPGQKADEVTYTAYVACAEMLGAMQQAIDDAHYIESSQQRQKLLYADLCIDFESPKYSAGPRWVG